MPSGFSRPTLLVASGTSNALFVFIAFTTHRSKCKYLLVPTLKAGVEPLAHSKFDGGMADNCESRGLRFSFELIGLTDFAYGAPFFSLVFVYLLGMATFKELENPIALVVANSYKHQSILLKHGCLCVGDWFP